MKLAGLVVAAHGRQYRVELADRTTLICLPRGKKSELVCGDQVIVEQVSPGQGVIGALTPRQTLLYRSDRWKQKLIAANVTQIIIVVATEPSFSDELVTRCIVAAESQGIEILIVLNKCDLLERLADARALLAPYRELGYRVLELAARYDTTGIEPCLARHTSLLIGQSGMGKSTLTNALIPHAQAAIRPVSQALKTGRHTTTHASLYHFGENATLIDSPGLMAFGLRHLSLAAIAEAFRELRPLLGQCRFRDCMHEREPDCSVLAALREGKISPRRYAAFRSLCAELA